VHSGLPPHWQQLARVAEAGGDRRGPSRGPTPERGSTSLPPCSHALRHTQVQFGRRPGILVIAARGIDGQRRQIGAPARCHAAGVREYRESVRDVGMRQRRRPVSRSAFAQRCPEPQRVRDVAKRRWLVWPGRSQSARQAARHGRPGCPRVVAVANRLGALGDAPGVSRRPARPRRAAAPTSASR
jgi:hypothetical protein